MHSPVYLMMGVRCIGISVLYLSGPKNNMLIRVLIKFDQNTHFAPKD